MLLVKSSFIILLFQAPAAAGAGIKFHMIFLLSTLNG